MPGPRSALRIATAVGVSAVLVSAAASCDAVLGLEQSSLATADAATADGGDASTTVDASGPPGVCGQGLPTTSYFQQVVTSCVMAVSCNPTLFPTTIGTCIALDYLHSVPTYDCLTNSKSCADFSNCEAVTFAAPGDCSKVGPRCVGAVAYNCAATGASTVIDCSKFGGTCALVEGPEGTGAACEVLSSCDDNDGVLHCVDGGTQLYRCLGRVDGGQVGVGEDCAKNNAFCSAYDGGAADCYLNGPACTDPGVVKCAAGDMVSGCDGFSRQLGFNCSQVGTSCAALPDGGVYGCLAPGCTIAGAEPCVDSCGADGKTLSVCVGGAKYPIDCTTVGDQSFTGCATVDGVVGCVGGPGAYP